MRLHEIKPGTIARCVLSPAGCPIACNQIVIRLPSGLFDPPIAPHPSFAATGYREAPEFCLLGTDLSADDVDLLLTTRARWADPEFKGTKWSLDLVAHTIGEVHTAERELAKARERLLEICTGTRVGPQGVR